MYALLALGEGMDGPDSMITVASRIRRTIFLLLAVALLVAACSDSDQSESDTGAGGTEAVGTGVLTVAGVDYDFEVFTCDLVGYENEGVEFDFDVAGIGGNEGGTYHVFARRSYHPDNDWWVEVIDLDYQNGDDGLHALHGFSAAEPEPFMFDLSSDEVAVEDPVAFVSDLVDETPAGQGTVAIACP